MSNQGLKYISNDSEKHIISDAIYTQRARETYISPNKQIKNQTQKDRKQFTNSPAHFNKIQNCKNNQILPPRAAPFKRTHNESIDKKEKDRLNSYSIGKGDQGTKDIVRFSALRKRLEQQIQERQRLQQLTLCQLIKIENLTEEINKLRGSKKQLDRFIFQIQKVSQQHQNNLLNSQQTVQQLIRNLKQAKINQKSLSNLKNLQNQFDKLQQRNKKLVVQNEELLKQNRGLKLQLDKMLRESTQDSESNVKGQAQVKRLLHQIQKSKSERQKLLEANLHQLQKRLYQTENQMKKMHIQLNCIDRKKTLSIDEVKSKKDQQIKDLRQKFMKVTKDLRETKSKNQKNEKKKPKQNPLLRKYKSSKNLSFNSQSQEVTFEFSSQV